MLTLFTQGGLKMLRKDVIISKTRKSFVDFINPIAAAADKPRRKFLRQSIGSVLLSGSLVVMQFTRLIHDNCSDKFYRLKRLLNHLKSPRGDLSPVVTAYRAQMAEYIEPDTLLIMDLTDLAKPRAKKMKYLSLVRDGSEGKLVNGYWCTEVYAYVRGKKVIPLCLDAYSVDDPSVGSQNLQIERSIDAIHKALNGKGIWLMDRGFDGLNLYETLFSRKCRFVVRQRGDRYVVSPNGVRIIETDLVERLRQRVSSEHKDCNMVFCKVKLPGYDQQLYLLARWAKGSDKPLMLLTNMVVETDRQAWQIINNYKKRWCCEEVIRFLKNRIGLEGFRIRCYEAIKRLMILAMLAMGFLTWILLKSRQLTKYLFSFTSRFRKDCRFKYYRLLDGLQQFARLKQLRFGETLLEPLKNG